MDEGTTDLAGWVSPFWLEPDPRGFTAADVDAAGNGGGEPVTYSDIGAYEYDVPPAQITDLAADVVWSSDIDLTWSAPVDAGMGAGDAYEIRFSSSSIDDETEWGSASPLTSTEPNPSVPPFAESHNAYVFQPSHWYYIRMKTRDSNQLWSPLSNQIYVHTLACCQSGARAIVATRASARASAGASGNGAEVGVGASANPSAIVLEMGRNGSVGDWTIYATGAEDWIRAGSGKPPFILLREPDGSGGWKARAQFAYSAGPLGVAAPYGGAGQVILVGPRGGAELRGEVQDGEGGTYTLSTANHSRLGDVSEAVVNGQLELAVGDTLRAHYVRSAEASGSAGSVFFIAETGMEGAASAPNARGAIPSPNAFALAQNQPNPFSATTTVRFAVPERVHVRLEVFDVQGRQVAQLANDQFEAGAHSVRWDRTGGSGQVFEPGVYLYRMSAGAFREERKMVVMP